MMDIEAEIQAGLALERDGKEQEAIDHFRCLVEMYPQDARVHFEYAGAFDFAGYEAEAIPVYYEAMALGLSGEELPRCYLQLGSSLRNVNRHEEAVQVLNEGCARFPDFRALRIFRAFALHSAGQPTEALVELLELILASSDESLIGRYRRAIRYYTDEIKGQ